MKIPRIADAISKIDDDLIIESEDKSEKQSKVIWLKVGIAVASLCIIVTGIIIVGNSFIKNNDNTKVNMDTINILDAYGFTLEGNDNLMFFPISFSDRKKYNLVPEDAIGLTPENTYVITEKDLGEVIGIVGKSENAGIVGKTVYHFAPYPDINTICILDNEGKYEFYTSHGYFLDLTEAKNSDVFMTAYELPDTCVQVEVFDPGLTPLFTITDDQIMEEICTLLSGCENIGREASERLFAKAWYDAYGNDDVYYKETGVVYRNTETYELAHEMWNRGEKCINIINKDGYGVFVDYFPSIGVFFVGNGQFSLSKQSVGRLNELLDK